MEKLKVEMIVSKDSDKKVGLIDSIVKAVEATQKKDPSFHLWKLTFEAIDE